MASGRAIKRIVVGLDGSADSEAALGWAIDMAKGMGSEVVVVFAIDLPTFYPEPYAIPLQFDDKWRKAMRADFEEKWCKPMRDAGIKYRPVMEDGRAASVITRIAAAEGADLIVVGRRGRGRVTELLLGSVTHELVLRSKVPVLVIEPRAAKTRKKSGEAA